MGYRPKGNKVYILQSARKILTLQIFIILDDKL